MTLSTGRTYSKVYPSVSIITLTWFCHTLLHWYADSWHRAVWGPAVSLLFNPLRTCTRMHWGTCWLWTGNVSHVRNDTHVTSPDLSSMLFSNLQIQHCIITVFRLWNVPAWCFTCKLEYHSACIQHLTQTYVKNVLTWVIVGQTGYNRNCTGTVPPLTDKCAARIPKGLPSHVPANNLNFDGSWSYAYCLVAVLPCRQVHREQTKLLPPYLE